MSNTITLREQLFESAAAILEEMCFMFPEQSDLKGGSKGAPEATAVISFDGPKSGEMIIIIYGKLLHSLSVNMTGQDELPSEKQLDALGEFANVLCGNLLPLVSDKGSVFTIHHPEVFDKSETYGELPVPTAAADIRVDEGEMSVMLFL